MQPEVETQIYSKLSEIEKEIETLKAIVIQMTPTPKQIVSLGGMLKGIEITEEEIKEAKNSLFKFSI